MREHACESDDTEDYVLVRCVRDRQCNDAMKRLMDRHTKYLHRCLAGFSSLTEDAVEYAFKIICNPKKPLPNHRNIRGWLLMVAQNKALDEVRRKARQRRLSSDPADRPNKDLPKINEMLRRRMDVLSAEQREVITLHYLDGLSYQEIEKKLGRPSGTLRSIVGRAKQEMNLLGDEE